MSKKIKISSIIFIILVSTYSIVSPAKLRIFGNNKLHYWQWKEGNRNFFDDVANFNATYGAFRGFIEWQTYEPSNLKDIFRTQGIRKRFLEYKKSQWSIRAGDFYQSFGRGLVLNQTTEEDGNIDRDINGLSMNLKTRLFSLLVLGGKPRNLIFSNGIYSITNDTVDVLEGTRLTVNIIPILPLEVNFARFTSLDPGVEEPHQTYIYSANVDVAKGPVFFYAEFAKKNGWDKILFSESTGNGFYSSANIFLANISASFEFLNYDSLGYGGSIYRYNAPPTANLDGYSINRAKDERGWMADISTTLLNNWYLRFNTSKLAAITSDSIGFDELFGEIKGDLTNTGPTLTLNTKNITYRKPEPIIDKKTELIPHIGISGILLGHSYSIGGNSRRVKIDTLTFVDNGISVDFGILQSLTISGRWETRDKEVLMESEGTDWKIAELRWDFGEQHTLYIMAGSEKGGLVCSGGVCRIEEPFDGVKVTLLSRF